ncbi:MAG TPA: helix-turn-helix domain-containing protein [Steroidobacteraceae bacterium]|nr:helix-turn-helix domain-containing protein [Steroidobacteraceae bacterium]
MPRRLPRSFNCPAEFTLAMIGGKWRTAILCYLSRHPMRYSELRRLLPQLSDKVLSERLRELEFNGLVTRNIRLEPSSVTVYGLSERGQSLQIMLNEARRWGAEHANIYGVRCDLRSLAVVRDAAPDQPLVIDA